MKKRLGRIVRLIAIGLMVKGSMVLLRGDSSGNKVNYSNYGVEERYNCDTINLKRNYYFYKSCEKN